MNQGEAVVKRLDSKHRTSSRISVNTAPARISVNTAPIVDPFSNSFYKMS
jgi:hypothetical protein